MLCLDLGPKTASRLSLDLGGSGLRGKMMVGLRFPFKIDKHVVHQTKTDSFAWWFQRKTSSASFLGGGNPKTKHTQIGVAQNRSDRNNFVSY